MPEIVIATYWYEHGAEDIYKDCEPSSNPHSLKDWQYNLVDHLAELIQKAREMGYTLKKEPFTLACRNIQQNYYIWKEKTPISILPRATNILPSISPLAALRL